MRPPSTPPRVPGVHHHVRTALALLAALLPIAAAAQDAPKPAPFTPGEEMVFHIEALGMDAGTARISVGSAADREGVSAWPIVILGKTDSLFDSVFSMKDKFVTWWEPESGRVLGADLFADEGGKKHRSRSVFDHAAGKASVRREKATGERSVSSYDIPAGVYDIAGAIFALRGRPLSPGSTEEVKVFTGRKVFTLRCPVHGPQKLKVPAGEFDAIAATISLGFDGKFASKRDLKAWFTNDERHVPLRAEAEFALGSIVGELTRYRKGVTL